MYTTQELNADRANEVHDAVETRNSEALFRLSRLEKEEGNDEFAESLYQLARRIDDADMAYDQWRDNQY